MCYKTVPVPIYQVQRIPVCCPGTTPVANGGCVWRNAGREGRLGVCEGNGLSAVQHASTSCQTSLKRYYFCG